MFGWVYDWLHSEYYTVAFFRKTYDLKKFVYICLHGAGNSTKVDETSPDMCELV